MLESSVGKASLWAWTRATVPMQSWARTRMKSVMTMADTDERPSKSRIGDDYRGRIWGVEKMMPGDDSHT